MGARHRGLGPRLGICRESRRSCGRGISDSRPSAAGLRLMGCTAQQMRSASKRKRRNRISEAWTSHIVSMLRSPPRIVLSRAARQFLDRLEIELCDHGGNDNGRLPLTFADCVAYGIHRNSVAAAQREAIALGFAELT